MEESAYDALIISAYVLVFITAMSATIYLLSTINKYSEQAFQYGRSVPQSSLLGTTLPSNTETNSSGQEVLVPSESSDIILLGTEVISYYYNYINLDNYNRDQIPVLSYIVTIDGVNMGETQLSYGQLYSRIVPTAKYILKVEGYENQDPSKKIRISITKSV
ncbi:hypothetical protein D3C76_1269020 [compost metagenome]